MGPGGVAAALCGIIGAFVCRLPFGCSFWGQVGHAQFGATDGAQCSVGRTWCRALGQSIGLGYYDDDHDDDDDDVNHFGSKIQRVSSPLGLAP